MNGYRRSRRLIQLAQLLAIASTTTAVSLQDFQFITIIQVPSLSCLGAYGSLIPGCSRRDFKDGVQCSESCAEGVQEDQKRIIEACKHVDVNERSLLGLALQGGLLDALCPNFQATSVTSTEKPTTTRTFLTPSQTQETSTITSTPETLSTITTSTSESRDESSTTADTITSTSRTESATATTETPSDIDTTMTSVTPTQTQNTETTPLMSSPTPTQTDDNDNGDADDNQPGRGSSGGGSPFDTVFIGGAETILRTTSSMLLTLTWSLFTALLFL
ncbi:hypothetical protein F5B22DRAFT_155454 [Xylaria bambusicola]|uniref:uncharacterized protein n=1 Tax=Xylaria bambusicola TaxID=326684 RepID=UPI0020083E57|nr:uncharacterized protein F5B22DRAFT_155454 [Xylaria bambusicola]KAI0526378.1 hypothetical protein F5B22DRAFT_155454 [Xylaria bambusicola]